MTSTSFLTREQQEILLPDEDIMLEPEGRDRRELRREMAPVTTVDAGQRYVTEGDGVYVRHDSDMPAGPTASGEVVGNLDVVRYKGDQVPLFRWTHGLTIDEEDLEIDGADQYLQRQMDALMETFSVQADLSFFLGIDDEQGTTVRQDVFTWLDNNIPSDNIIDCSSIDVANDLNGIQANIVKSEAYSKTSGEYVDTQWDVAVAKHDVWADWNQYTTNDGSGMESLWKAVQEDRDTDNVGINRRITMPEQIGLRTAPDEDDTLQFDLSTLGSDEMYILPDHGGDFFELYEMPSPDARDPLRKEGFKERHEFKWRAGHVFNLGHRTNEATDAIKLTNVSSLF